MKWRFKLGSVVMTRGVADLMGEEKDFANFVQKCLGKHGQGDWGDLGEYDKGLNDLALRENERLLSTYKMNSWKVWIITEADRSATTILFPDEY